VHSHLVTILLSLASLSFFSTACTADLTEICVSGGCNQKGLPEEVPLGAGGGDGGGGGLVVCAAPAGPPTGDIPCEVFEVIRRECHSCHTNPPANGAPFPLLSYEDTQATYFMDIKRYQRMNEVIRPNGSPRMPLGGMLKAADLAILGDWLNQCAPPTADGMGCECPAPGMGCN
jgi:hypothetical protein